MMHIISITGVESSSDHHMLCLAHLNETVCRSSRSSDTAHVCTVSFPPPSPSSSLFFPLALKLECPHEPRLQTIYNDVSKVGLSNNELANSNCLGVLLKKGK